MIPADCAIEKLDCGHLSMRSDKSYHGHWMIYIWAYDFHHVYRVEHLYGNFPDMRGTTDTYLEALVEAKERIYKAENTEHEQTKE